MKFPSSARAGTSATRDRGAAYGSVAMAVPPFFLAKVGEGEGRGAPSAPQGRRVGAGSARPGSAEARLRAGVDERRGASPRPSFARRAVRGARGRNASRRGARNPRGTLILGRAAGYYLGIPSRQGAVREGTGGRQGLRQGQARRRARRDPARRQDDLRRAGPALAPPRPVSQPDARRRDPGAVRRAGAAGHAEDPPRPDVRGAPSRRAPGAASRDGAERSGGTKRSVALYVPRPRLGA